MKMNDASGTLHIGNYENRLFEYIFTHRSLQIGRDRVAGPRNPFPVGASALGKRLLEPIHDS